MSEHRESPGKPRNPECSSPENLSNFDERQSKPFGEHSGSQSPVDPEWDKMGQNGTGNKNFCPTGASDCPFSDPELDLLDVENPFSRLAKDLLEVLEVEEDAPEDRDLLESSLTERQRAALPYIAAFPNMGQAARAAGIGRSTLYRWMEDESFREEVTRLREAAAQLACVQLQGQMLTAVQVLGETMRHEDAAIRLRAARFVLQFGLQTGELQQLTQDIEDLKNSLHRWDSGPSLN